MDKLVRDPFSEEMIKYIEPLKILEELLDPTDQAKQDLDHITGITTSETEGWPQLDKNLWEELMEPSS